MIKVNINKSQVARRFAKATQSYNQQAFVQKDICFALIGLIRRFLTQEHLSKVLEIGCGSGNLTTLLLQKIQIDQLYLNDIYPEIEQHFIDFPEISFCIGDVEQIELPAHLDLVCSSSALQWMDDLAKLMSTINHALQPNGYFCFSTFGPDNLQQIKQLTGQGLSYLTMQEIQTMLIEQGFEILHLSEETKTLSFEHPKDILKHLKATGVTATASGHRWNKASLQSFYQDYQKYGYFDAMNQMKYPLTYHPIYCVARREK